MVGLNLKQAFGGLCKPGTWKQSKTKLMDPNKAIRRQGLAVVETSCDENESSLEQKIDDDKMELMCHEKLQDYVDFELSRYGQVRSPFQIETAQPVGENEESKEQPKQIFLAVDGEFY